MISNSYEVGRSETLLKFRWEIIRITRAATIQEVKNILEKSKSIPLFFYYQENGKSFLVTHLQSTSTPRQFDLFKEERKKYFFYNQGASDCHQKMYK